MSTHSPLRRHLNEVKRIRFESQQRQAEKHMRFCLVFGSSPQEESSRVSPPKYMLELINIDHKRYLLKRNGVILHSDSPYGPWESVDMNKEKVK